MKNGFEIIDAHCHIYPAKIAAAASAHTGEFYSIPMAFDGTVESLLEEGDGAGIDRYLVQSVAVTAKQVRSINRYIAGEVEKSGGKFIGFGTLHPDSEDLEGDLEGRWLKSGQAIWYGNSRTTIQFVRSIDTQTQPLTLGVNTGFHLGMAVVGNDREYYASESIRKSEKDRITARREYRRTRRNRLRYRKPRFDNRRRKAGWLAPSVQHRLEFTVREIQRLYRFLPISQLVVEVSPFDNQKLANPDIKPWQYTQGKMHGY